LTKQKDVIIIGAGIAGLSSAYFLAKAGRSVTLVDKGPVEASATWAAAGMLAPVHELEFTEVDLLAASLHSKAMFEEWERELGDIGLQRSGMLEIALLPEDVPYLERQFSFQRQQGLRVEWLKGSALQQYEPELSQRIPAAIYAPEDYHVDNRLLAMRLQEALQAKGAEWITAAAQDWSPLPGNQGIVLATDQGELQCDSLIWASGASSSAAGNYPEKVYPVKGQSLSLITPQSGLLRRPVRIRNRAYGNAYLVPKADRIVLGATSEEMGYDTSVTAGGLLDLLRKAYAAVPAVYDLAVGETYAGLRPATISRQPLVEAHPEATVYYVNGLYRHGILLSPLIGQSLTKLVQQGHAFSLADFR
jgi:glycine oxidase